MSQVRILSPRPLIVLGFIPQSLEKPTLNLGADETFHAGPGDLRTNLQMARNATVTGTRAALIAGRKPPLRPMASAQMIPTKAIGAVTAR